MELIGLLPAAGRGTRLGSERNYAVRISYSIEFNCRQEVGSRGNTTE